MPGQLAGREAVLEELPDERLVLGERREAAAQVARRRHVEVAPQPPRAPAVVGRRDDGGDARHPLEAAEDGRKAGASAEADDPHSAARAAHQQGLAGGRLRDQRHPVRLPRGGRKRAPAMGRQRRPDAERSEQDDDRHRQRVPTGRPSRRRPPRRASPRRGCPRPSTAGRSARPARSGGRRSSCRSSRHLAEARVDPDALALADVRQAVAREARRCGCAPSGKIWAMPLSEVVQAHGAGVDRHVEPARARQCARPVMRTRAAERASAGLVGASSTPCHQRNPGTCGK